MPFHVILEPEALDYAMSRRQYDAAVEELADLGYSVELRLRSKDRDVAEVVATLFVYLGEHLADAALAAFLETLFQQLRMRPAKSNSAPPVEKRRFVLIDADGSVVREVEVERDPS